MTKYYQVKLPRLIGSWCLQIISTAVFLRRCWSSVHINDSAWHDFHKNESAIRRRLKITIHSVELVVIYETSRNVHWSKWVVNQWNAFQDNQNLGSYDAPWNYWNGFCRMLFNPNSLIVGAAEVESTKIAVFCQQFDLMTVQTSAGLTA